MSTPAPETFGKYVLDQRIAAGGMAEVFRATMRGPAGIEKVVALKRILPIFGGERDFVDMFKDEARIAMSLAHTNIAQVFDFGEVGGSYYLAMEFVEGTDLGRLVERAAASGLRIPQPMACFLIAEAARGLDYAHERTDASGHSLGIVHRDVSPPNILLSTAGDVKIADFGISKAIGKLHKTATGAVMGKFRYMSPEQVAGLALDRRSDVFALGVILWELLTGHALFSGESATRVAECVQKADVPAPSLKNPEVPPELDRIALRALAARPAGRYARAAELARDLKVHLSRTAPEFGREDLGQFVARFAFAPVQKVTRIERQTSAAWQAPGDQPTQAAQPHRGGPTELGSLATDPTVIEADTVAAVPSALASVRTRRSGRAVMVVAGALLLVGAALVWRYLLAAPGTSLRIGSDASPSAGSTASPFGAPPPTLAGSPDALAPPPPLKLPRPFDPIQLARLEQDLEATPNGHYVSRRGVLAEDFVVLASAVNDAFAGATASGPGPVREDITQRIEAAHLAREVQTATACLFGAGALPSGFRAALEAFLRRNEPWRADSPAYDVSALAVLIDPKSARMQAALVRATGTFAQWRGAQGLLNPALRSREAAMERLGQLDPSDPLVRAWQRFRAAVPKGTLGGLLVEVSSAGLTGPGLVLHVRARNPSGPPVVLRADWFRVAGSRAPRPPGAFDVGPPLDPGATRELDLPYPLDGPDEPLVFIGPPEIRAWAGPLR